MKSGWFMDPKPSHLPHNLKDRRVSTWSLGEILTGVMEGDIDPQPVYQRHYIMENDENFRNGLIESVLCNCSIPSLYFCETDHHVYDVLDGQQRVRTLVDFMKGEWKLNKNKMDEEKWNEPALDFIHGKNFKDLTRDQQKSIKKYTLQVEVFSETDEWSASDVYRRINKGASNLNKMELLKSQYLDEYQKVKWKALSDFAGTETWEGFCGQKQKRMGAQEALIYHLLWADHAWGNSFAPDTYGKTRAKQVAAYLEHIMGSSTYDVEVSLKRVEKWMQMCTAIYGDKPFMVRNFKLSDGDNGGKVTKPLVKTFYALFSSVIPRMVNTYDGLALHRASKLLREDFMLFVNDDVNTDYAGKTPYFQYIEGRQQQHGIQVSRAEWYWARVQNIMHDFEVDLDPTRCFPEEVFEQLWADEDNRTCCFCSTSIAAKGQAVADHQTHHVDGGRTTIENARLAHRYCNWYDGQRKAHDRKMERMKAAEGSE